MQANSLGGSEGSSRTEERVAYLSKELGIGHCPTGSLGGNVDNSVTGMPYKKTDAGSLEQLRSYHQQMGYSLLLNLLFISNTKTPTNPATRDGGSSA